jgi:hypothetical protein
VDLIFNKECWKCGSVWIIGKTTARDMDLKELTLQNRYRSHETKELHQLQINLLIINEKVLVPL